MYDIHSHCFPNTNPYSVINIKLIEVNSIIEEGLTGFFSTGFHPCEINSDSFLQWNTLENCISDERFVAVGECGFDKNSKAPFELQKDFFIQQINISEKYQKPLIIHCVGYFNELISIKKQQKPSQKWIIHGFRGKPQLAQQLIRAGFCLSYGERFNAESVRITPLEVLFVETDESSIPVSEIYLKIASLKKCDMVQLNAGYLLFNKFLKKH